MKEVKKEHTVILLMLFALLVLYFLAKINVMKESLSLLLIVALACFSMIVFASLLLYLKVRQERILRNREELSFRVDYDYSARKLIKRGNYVLCSRVITWENFPRDRTGKKKLKAILYKVDEPTMVLEALEDALKSNPGFRAANLFEALWFGVYYPRIIRENIIVSLDKSYSFNGGNGMRVWPFLCRERGKNEVDAYPLGVVSFKELILLVKD